MKKLANERTEEKVIAIISSCVFYHGPIIELGFTHFECLTI